MCGFLAAKCFFFFARIRFLEFLTCYRLGEALLAGTGVFPPARKEISCMLGSTKHDKKLDFAVGRLPAATTREDICKNKVPRISGHVLRLVRPC